jgi:hypothetical protein
MFGFDYSIDDYILEIKSALKILEKNNYNSKRTLQNIQQKPPYMKTNNVIAPKCPPVWMRYQIIQVNKNNSTMRFLPIPVKKLEPQLIIEISVYKYMKVINELLKTIHML